MAWRFMDKDFLTGWGNVKFSESILRKPTTSDEIRKVIFSLGRNGGIPRGSGRSYGDQAMNNDGEVIHPCFHTKRWADVSSQGQITVKSSATFFELLKEVVPRGWYLPVVPGTGFVTIGGAIAADIHGKNHYRESSIANHIKSMTLMLASGETVDCSQSKESDIFWATVGGLGLTGVILEATIQLVRIQSGNVLVDRKRFQTFDDLFENMKSSITEYDYGVAWLDLISRSNPGRGVIERANHENLLESPNLSYETKPLVNVPAQFPNKLLNQTTVRSYNALRFFLTGEKSSLSSKALANYMHPLDRIGSWNRLYGQTGVIQWQAVIPETSEHALFNLVQSISNANVPAFLAVLKRLGSSNNAPLSFPMSGWTLAVDFPANRRPVYEFLDLLDIEVVNAGGRIYLAKDIRLNPELFSKMYPRVDEWNSIRKTIDPNGRWQSDFSRRLGL